MSIAFARRRSAVAAAALGVVLAATGAVAPTAGATDLPAPPTGLRTMPGTDCAGGTVLGLGDVTLFANASDSGKVEFQLLRSGTGAPVDDVTLSATPGTAAVHQLSRDVLTAAAGGTITDFDWKARAQGGQVPGDWSTTCHFRYDPTVPTAAPTVSVPSGLVIGTPAQITVTAGPGEPPAAYAYQVGGEAPKTATADASGNAVLTVTPVSAYSNLTVVPLSPGGNRGPQATAGLNAAQPPRVAGDIDGDGRPDLLLVGGQFGLGDGLWLAKGQGGGVLAPAVQVGAAGTGRNAPGGAADWNGVLAVGGRFNGSTADSVLAYVPSVGVGTALPYAAGGFDPSKSVNIGQHVFDDGTKRVERIADAGELYSAGNGYPTGFRTTDGLLVLAGGKLIVVGSASFPGAFQSLESAVELSDVNPAGTGDWHGWSITTAVLGAERLPGLFARNDADGSLYYYAASTLTGPFLGDPIGTPVLVAAGGWDAASKPVLRATDLDGDGLADLWAVDAQGNATGYRFDGTTLTALATSPIHPAN
ncbi:FG-GAP repeat domain-containing protein [Kitasatospora sp. CB01950]|uniref:FG-GAP repeat domain-containing protein n=1 Tax=Kitasatospora sp. CB01950 TaxID=1703930 RepID=UPI000938B54E|nr:VCBS repeat-containing protein [Kitasatospora sp. CB01950]OKJ17115.1 hypothetical protein AMK19_03105 [Kitasatospora sp. CB01950]